SHGDGRPGTTKTAVAGDLEPVDVPPRRPARGRLVAPGFARAGSCGNPGDESRQALGRALPTEQGSAQREVHLVPSRRDVRADGLGDGDRALLPAGGEIVGPVDGR